MKFILPQLTINNVKLLGYSMVFFIASTADAIMSYMAPAYIENRLNTPFLMGLIIATSSLVGIVSDFLIGGWLRGHRSRFFSFWALVLAVAFPTCFILLPAEIPTFLMAMAIWGIYYEMVQFSNYHFVHEHAALNQHSFAWGLLSMVRAAAYTIGPVIAGMGAAQLAELPFFVSFVLSIIALIAVCLYLSVSHRSKSPHVASLPVRTIASEIKVWKLLTTKVWHLFTFLFALSLIDATFWTVGVLFSEEIGHGEQGLLLAVYGLPSLLIGLFAGVISRPLGKKRVAFVAGICGGVLLTLMSFTKNDLAVLALVFASSCFLAISWPEIYAAFEDYVSRLGKVGNEFIGLQSSVNSMSYILGPIIAGTIANFVGNQATFAFVGIFLTAVSVMALVVVPRKVHMPQTALQDIV